MELIERIACYSIAVNIAVSMLDFGMAYFSGSLALAAETIHNIVDLTASAAVLIGLKLAYRISESFPYGLYKVENVIAALIAFFVLFTGYEIAGEAVFATGRHVLVVPPCLAELPFQL
jgi:divalent metal cation (Fe/Co/Zn/Cd) transporter